MTQSRLNYERLMPLFVLTFVDVLGLTIILPLLHLYALAYNATPLQIGLVTAAFPLAQVIGVPVMGALSDRYGRKPLLLTSQFATFISFLMLAAANSLEMIILSRVVDGIFGANLATAQAAVTDMTNDETRAQGLGMTGAAFGLGFVFGPAISLITLEFTDSLAMPALIAAAYSLLSIAFTMFGFKETLSVERRRENRAGRRLPVFGAWQVVRNRRVNFLIVILFLQQVVFFAFESLLGLFTLSRFGLLGQGNSLIFVYVGLLLVYVQARLIGRWRQRYGERRLVTLALAALGIGLLLSAVAPEQPHPFYVTRIVESHIRELAPSATETIIGDIAVSLPAQTNRGVGGLLWFLVALIPLTIGAGLIRPALNNLIVKWSPARDSGAVLGVSASAVSMANAVAPLAGGWLFQTQGPSAPLLVGGGIMLALLGLSLLVLRQGDRQPASD